MPNWKKLIVSGSDANLNSLDVLASITGSTFLVNNTISIADGTAAAPSLRFTDDPNTGIYRSTDDSFNITVGGVNKFVVNSSGITSAANVYSGTNGQFRNYAGVWKATAGTTGNGFNFSSADLSDLLTISSTGDSVFKGDITIADTTGTRGISRNNTGYNLNLMGGTDLTDGAYISLSGETRGGASNSYNGRIEIYSGGGGLANQAAALGDIIFGTKWNGGSSNILVLDSSTNNATFAGDIDADDITINDWGSVSASLSTLTQNQIDGSGTADYVARFSDANTLTTGTIRDDGSTVGINAAPSANKTLYIDGTLQATGEAFFSHLDILGTSGNSRIRDDIQFKFGTNRVFGIQYNSSGDYLEFTSGSNNLVTLLGNGNLGIGATNPGDKLQVAGNAIVQDWAYIGDGIAHWGDGDTNITFATDRQTFRAGNVEFVDFANTTQDYITVGGTSDIDARLQGGSGYVFVQGSNGYVGINDASPTVPLDISGNTRISGDLDVTGNITAQEFHTEFVSASIIYESGSTKFGDTSDDVHDFTGSVYIQGNYLNVTHPSPTIQLQDTSDDDDQKIRFLNNGGSIEYVIQTQDFTSGGDGDGLSIGSVSSDPVRFATANTTALTIDTSQNVGIGTSSPTGKFNSYISATRQLTHNGNGGDFSILSDNNSNPVFYVKGTGTADLVNIFDNTTEVFTILDGGNVGIGTTSPGQKLEVAGRVRATTDPTFEVYNSTANRGGIQWSTGVSGTNIFAGGNSSAGAVMTFQTNTAERMRISSAGALKFNSYGSGTHTGTLAKSLGVDSSGNVIEFSGGSGGSVSAITNGADNRIATFTGADSLNGEANLTFDGDIFAVNTDELYVSASRVGIGTTSPTQTLEVNGAVLAGDYRGSTHIYLTSPDSWIFRSTGGTERMKVDSAGSLLLGNTTAYQRVIFDPTPSTVLGNGTLTITPSTAPGSGTAQFYTRFLDRSGGGITKHNVIVDGKVGIGTTSPASALHVYGDGPAIFENAANTDIDVRWRSAGSNKYNAFYQASTDSWGIYHNPASAYRFFITGSNGNIGIGTNTPTQKLEVHGNVKVGDASADNYLQAVFSDGTETRMHGYGLYMSRTNSYIRPTSDGGQILAIGTDNNTWNYVALDTNYFTVSTNASEHFRITNTGNVGIGTANPGAKLDVHGRVDFANDLRLRGTDSAADQGVVRFFVDSNNKLSIDTANDGSNQFVIDSSGNVGIGSNTPARKLDVNGEIQNNGIFRRAGNVIIKSTGSETMFGPGGSGIITFHNSATMTTGDETMRIDANGNLLLNNTSAGARLDIREDSNYAIRAEDASGHYFRVNTGGDVDMRGDLTVQGIITAQEFHTEFVSASIVHESGSSQFGNSADDNHIFTGSIKVTNLQTNGETLFEAQRHPNFYFKIQDYAQVDHKVNGAVNAFTIRNTAASQAAPVLRLGHGTAGSPHISTYSTNEDLTIDPNGTGRTRVVGDISGSGDLYLGSTINQIHVGYTGETAGNGKLKLYTDASYNATVTSYQYNSNLDLKAGVSGSSYVNNWARIRLKDNNSGNGHIGFWVSGSEYARIDNSGNVGIGTTNPSAKLEINGGTGVATAGAFILRQTGNSASDGMSITSGHATSTRIYKDSNGVFNFGPSSNANAFQQALNGNITIEGSIDADDITIDDWGSVSASLSAIQQAGGVNGSGTANTITKWSDSDTLTDSYLTQPSATTLKLSSDGSATAGTILELHFPNNNTNDRCATINFTNNVGGYAAIEGGTTGANNTGYIGFKVDNAGTQSESMRIIGNGNVGIGTTSPKQQLHIAGGTASGDVTKAVIGATGGNAESYLYLAENFSGDNVNWGFSFVADGNSSNNLLIKRHSNSTSGTTVLTINRDNSDASFSGALQVGSNLDVNGTSLTLSSAAITYQNNNDVDTGTETIATVVKANHDAAFFDYVVKNGTNLRAGTVMAVHDGTNVEFTDNSTKDIGDTSGVTFSVDISGTDLRLRATTTSDNWIIKSLVRSI